MKIILGFIFLSIAGIFVQENAAQNVPSSVVECYNTSSITEKDNRLPHNIHTLIAIIRKIENTPGLNMDLRTLSVALLHRFRVDGIERVNSDAVQDGIVPFSPQGFSYARNFQTHRIVTGNAVAFPNSSLTLIERCTLHQMLSSSIELQQRGDEKTVCTSLVGQQRVRRQSDGETPPESEPSPDDAETLTPEEPEPVAPSVLGGRTVTTVTQSTCPVENGVISTSWGAVSAGPVIAGIASALVQQIVPLASLMDEDAIASGYSNGSPIHNRWLATFAGDLAEAALRQRTSNASKIGVAGGFNSSTLPKWYFLTSALNHELTDAEIRGDLDGLILADSVASWYSSVPNLRLSQILDMYYSSQGSFNTSMRACGRVSRFYTVATNATVLDQTISASLLLHESIAQGTISPDFVRSYATSAVSQLDNYVTNLLNNGLNCVLTDTADEVNKPSTHLTIILDTTWPFATLQPLLITLLEGIQVGMFNSNFTLINGIDGSVIINTTNTLLDIYSFNSTQYANLTSGFDLPRSLDRLRTLQTERLDREQSQNLGGTNSDVVLILSYLSTLSDADKEYVTEQLRVMREQVPDAQFLYLTHGAVDTWSSLAVDSATSIFTSTNTTDVSSIISPVVSRIKELPNRLINTACGSSFSSSGSSPASWDQYLQPSAINYYRLHPNYFSAEATVSVQGEGWANLTICSSRTVLRPNSTISDDVSCASLLNGKHNITISCDDAELISSCQPLYLSVEVIPTNTSANLCTDATICRYPDMRRYIISYENLDCRSSATAFFIAPFILILSFVLNFVN